MPANIWHLYFSFNSKQRRKKRLETKTWTIELLEKKIKSETKQSDVTMINERKSQVITDCQIRTELNFLGILLSSISRNMLKIQQHVCLHFSRSYVRDSYCMLDPVFDNQCLKASLFKISEMLDNLIRSYDLVDIWRLLNPTTKFLLFFHCTQIKD